MNKKITGKKTVGAKQTIKAVKSGNAQKIYIARDADPKLIAPVLEACKEVIVEIIYVENMQTLGSMCGIDVGAATACVIND